MIVWDFNFSIEILELSIEILVGQPEAYKLSSLSCFGFFRSEYGDFGYTSLFFKD